MHWKRAGRAAGTIPNDPWDARRKANWRKREALKKGAPAAEPFRYDDVFERDGWVCGICSRLVDKSLAWPDPLSRSLDHILPLSRGGTHTADNAQCAHLICNVRKGDSVAV